MLESFWFLDNKLSLARTPEMRPEMMEARGHFT